MTVRTGRTARTGHTVRTACTVRTVRTGRGGPAGGRDRRAAGDRPATATPIEQQETGR
ncbi:hypothetical protein ACGFZS_45290 [Streptomyces sp. NPDC048288]|uniref:hypothetical protein n=1 Tax=Streptomyces sp. NPDC048288 TaxID=3365529 RepID=UPI003718F193